MGARPPLAGSPLFGLLAPDLQDELIAAARPVSVPARDWLFHEGDAGDCIYVVVSGRMRVVADRDDRQLVLDTLGPGAVLGELAILTGAQRSASVQALRDTELLEIDGVQFELLLDNDPGLAVGLARALAERIQRGDPATSGEVPTAVVTVTSSLGTDADGLWRELERAFSELGDTWAEATPGVEWVDPHEWGRVLGELERAHDYVLLRAPLDDSDWSGFCLRQADRVVVIGGEPPAQATPTLHDCDLVFLRTPSVNDVAGWFERVQPRAHYVIPAEAALTDAARRLARRLTGRSLGIVLSGGGARAYAHIGVLEALAAEGVVIDRYGGCSMGAFVAGLAALGQPPDMMLEVCTHELTRRRAPFNDYTFPRHALIRARRAASMLERVFGDVAIEQLAWPLYTVSADLLSSRMIVHRKGSLLEAVGASMAIPGLAPPVARRSELLVDGGVLNNLPIDVMVGDEPGPVVGVDVIRRLERAALGSEEPQALLPTILETLSRATVLGSVERAESNRELATLLVTPDVQDIPLRGFKHLTRAVDAGRRAAEEALAAGGKELLEEAQGQSFRVRVEARTTA
jgi:predicted acylesterase/phospholipase RssA